MIWLNNDLREGGNMPIFLIIACEVASFSFLIGSFLRSITVGVAVSVLSGIFIYSLFQQFYNPRILVCGVTILASFATLLWSTYIDAWLGTIFMTLILTFIIGLVCYVLNDELIKKYYG